MKIKQINLAWDMLKIKLVMGTYRPPGPTLSPIFDGI